MDELVAAFVVADVLVVVFAVAGELVVAFAVADELAYVAVAPDDVRLYFVDYAEFVHSFAAQQYELH